MGFYRQPDKIWGVSLYIYLDIVAEFACKMCGACCRNDWMVTVDRPVYDRNRELFKATGREAEFAQAFIPLAADKAGPGEYAFIAKQQQGVCWFLESSNLCRLHKEAGHSHLDTVCQTFPRYPMNTARGLEITLSFSCPAVLELVCRTEPLLVVRSDAAPTAVDENNCVAAVFPKQQSSENALRYYFEIEQHFIDIMQCRSMTIRQRLDLIRETAVMDEKPNGCEPVSRSLDTIFRRNYELLDCQADAGTTSTGPNFSADILIEHFFVNLIFKKIFYLYGLSKASCLLDRFWREIDAARQGACDEQEECRHVLASISGIEFLYGHNRQELYSQKEANP